MKPLCPKCLTTHWTDQACKTAVVFPEAMVVEDKLPPSEPEEVVHTFPPDPPKPKKVLSKEHLAKMKAGREARYK